MATYYMNSAFLTAAPTTVVYWETSVPDPSMVSPGAPSPSGNYTYSGIVRERSVGGVGVTGIVTANPPTVTGVDAGWYKV